MTVYVHPSLRRQAQAYQAIARQSQRRGESLVDTLAKPVRVQVHSATDALECQQLRRTMVFARAKILAYCPARTELPPTPGEHVWRDAGQHFYRLDYKAEPPGPGDHTLPSAGTDGWAPKCWIRLRDLPTLPPRLQRAWLKRNWRDQLLDWFGSRAECRLTPEGQLTLFDAHELLPENESVQAIVSGWPLKYVPRRYLEWLVGDGTFRRTTRVRRAWKLPQGGWAHEPGEPGMPGWDLLVDEQMATARDDGAKNVLRQAILRFLAGQLREVSCRESGVQRLLFFDEPLYDDDPELVTRDGFCTWGWWDDKDVFHATGTAQKVRWHTHETPVWINSTNKYRAGQVDTDPTWAGARLGLTEKGSNGKLYLRDQWEPSRAEEPGRVEVRLPQGVLKQAWLRGALTHVPRAFLARIDYEPPRPPSTPEAALRMYLKACQEVDTLEDRMAWWQGQEDNGYEGADHADREEVANQVIRIWKTSSCLFYTRILEYYPELAKGLDLEGRCEKLWKQLQRGAGNEEAHDESQELDLSLLAWRALDELEKFLQRRRNLLAVWAQDEGVRRAREETARRRLLTDLGPAQGQQDVAEALQHWLLESLATLRTGRDYNAALVDALEVAAGQYGRRNPVTWQEAA
jgi:hypothetical protein